jgi:hypothetical protein
MNTSRYIEAIAELHDRHRLKMQEASKMYDECLTKMMEDFIKASMDAERELEEELTNLVRKI